MARDILDPSLLGLGIEDPLPQGARGIEVLLADLGEEGDGVSSEVSMELVQADSAFAEMDRLDRADVVRSRALVEERHTSVSLEVCEAVIGPRSVDGQLLVVDTDAMAVCVGVREESRLQDRVGGRFNSWNHV